MGKGLPKTHTRGIFIDGIAAGGVSYSNDEQDTGLDWTDGDPVFQKTLTPTQALNGATFNFAHGITGLKKLLRIVGSVESGTGAHRPIPYATTAGTSFTIEIQQVTATNVVLVVGSGWNRSTGALSLDDPIFTLLYTKT